MSNKELTSKIDRLREMRAEIDQKQKEADRLADTIKAEMLRRNVEEVETDSTKATYKVVKSSRLDTAALKESHSKIYERFLKAIETRRFVVSMV